MHGHIGQGPFGFLLKTPGSRCGIVLPLYYCGVTIDVVEDVAILVGVYEDLGAVPSLVPDVLLMKRIDALPLA